MAFSFNGTTKIITCSVGTTGIDVKYMYSRWKDWVHAEDGNKYLHAFSVVGGDPVDITEGIYVATYLFLENGWRIRPQEANHKLRVYNGILLTSTGDDPFVQTLGSYNVLVQYSQPVASQAVMLETGVSGLTSTESAQLMKALTVAKYLGLR